MRLDMAVHAWGHMMHEQNACDLVLPFESLTLLRVKGSIDISLRIRQFGLGDIGCTGCSSCCKVSKGGQQRLHWRQPLTSDSQALVPEMTNLHQPIGRATDIRT